MSDTPKTDAAWDTAKWNFDSSPDYEMREFARQLERELNEARALNGELVDRLSRYVENDETFSDDDEGFWASIHNDAVTTIQKAKEAK